MAHESMPLNSMAHLASAQVAPIIYKEQVFDLMIYFQ